MNNHSKRLMKDLEALGFVRDDEARTKGIAYRHPNQPTEIVKVFDAMSDGGRTAALRMANKIADTGWSGPRMPTAVKERAAISRRKAKTQRQRDDEARRARAEQKEREVAAHELLVSHIRQSREIESLMQPSGERGRLPRYAR